MTANLSAVEIRRIMNGDGEDQLIHEVKKPAKRSKDKKERAYEPPLLNVGAIYAVCYKGEKYQVKIIGRTLPSESLDRKEWLVIEIPAGMHNITTLTEMTVQREVFLRYLEEAEQLR